MTQQFKTLGDVIALAEFAHRNQTDKAGEPYIKHPKRVLAKVQAQGAQPYVQMAAVLHDVTEDTAFTPSMLADLGVPESAVAIVKLLDRDYSKVDYLRLAVKSENDSQKEQIDEHYYAAIRRNPGALMVKLADIEDNLSAWRLTYLPEETQARLRMKYAKAQIALGVIPDYRPI